MGHSYQDLIDAVYLDFEKIPVTELGYSFCDQMMSNIEANEKRTRARRKPPLFIISCFEFSFQNI